jgi:hypothetical protein
MFFSQPVSLRPSLCLVEVIPKAVLQYQRFPLLVLATTQSKDGALILRLLKPLLVLKRAAQLMLVVPIPQQVHAKLREKSKAANSARKQRKSTLNGHILKSPQRGSLLSAPQQRVPVQEMQLRKL